MRKLLATIVLFVIVCAPVAQALEHTNETPTSEADTTVVSEPTWPSLDTTNATNNEFLALMARPEAPPMEYWLRLAHCETRINYANEGHWGGAFGFYTRGNFAQSTMGGWERFGGEMYADHPKDAQPVEQFVVAMRTAFAGWYGTVVDRGADLAKRKGVPRFYVWDRSPFGYWTWGCAKRVVGDPCGYLFDGTKVAVAHAKPAYCKHLKPIDYSKVDGSARYRHNDNTRKAIAKANASQAKSVATKGALLFAMSDQLPVEPSVVVPSDARCPAYWQAARDAGFPLSELPNVDRIMWRESRCKPNAHNKANDTLGLMQISGSWTTLLRTNIVLESTKHLLDANTNLHAAFVLYQYNMRKHGWGWLPWGFTSGNTPLLQMP